MGKVTTEATVENVGDVWNAESGILPIDQIRTVRLTDALVDTGATLLSLPTTHIRHLGLRPVSIKRVIASSGPTQATLYSAVRLTIMGRSCTMDVLEVPDSVPALIGVIPLEHLDFVVDPKSQKLIGNPAHNGEHVYEMY